MFFGDFFSNAFSNLGNLGSAFLVFGDLTNMFLNQQVRRSQQQQYYRQAELSAQQALEEDYKYRAMAHKTDLQASSDIKKYLAGVSVSGFKLSGSVLDNVSQIRDMFYNEKINTERVRDNVVNSLMNSAYNYSAAADKAQAYGYLSDIMNIFSIGAKGEYLKEKYG